MRTCRLSPVALLTTQVWWRVIGFEALVGVPCDVEIASEFRYRKSAVRPGSLIITLSHQAKPPIPSAALRLSKELGYLGSLAVCNVAGSSLVRESDWP